MHAARTNQITSAMQAVAKAEYMEPDALQKEIAEGRLVIPANINHRNLAPIGIGIAARCKINANIGNSAVVSNIKEEICKLRAAAYYGADTVMDLSTGGDIPEIRRHIIEESTIPVGTVPMYEIMARINDINEMSPQLILDVIQEQAEQGVDFMTIHCGFLQKMIPATKKRKTGIVSRGGALMAQWMSTHNKENPIYTQFDEILTICQQYDVTLSLGDGLRPGCLADASDEAQFMELKVLGELTRQAWEKDVQVMIEGPGHVPFNQIEMNVQKQMEWCHEAPFYVLGPIVTDVAPGYDHITSAIGATMAGYAGASMLCYVTPKEHLGLPNMEDVRQGVIAYRIAAHAVDVARNRKHARDWDDKMAQARFHFDWEKQFELAMDPDRARSMREETLKGTEFANSEYCSMCGPKFCAMKLSKEV